MKLHDRVAVVTGAASGIGRALCPLLARQGARLILLDRNAAGLQSVAEELAAENARVLTAAVDVRHRDELRSAMQTLSAQFGPADLLVASAGITGLTLLEDLGIEDLEAIMRVNFLGVVHAVEAVLPQMLARGRGQIVGVSSLAGCRGMPFAAAYCASKAAVSLYLEGLRVPLRRRGIAVTVVCPGFVRTPLMENSAMKAPVRMLEPDVAARYVLKGILRRRRFYCFPWGISLTIKLLRWLPAAWYDWTMRRAAAKVPDLIY